MAEIKKRKQTGCWISEKNIEMQMKKSKENTKNFVTWNTGRQGF
jgi:hypothetical protein